MGTVMEAVKSTKTPRGWDLSHILNPKPAEPIQPQTVKETYREQVMHDYYADKL